MKVSSQQLTVRQLFNGRSPIATLKDAADAAFGADATPIRVAVTSKSRAGIAAKSKRSSPRFTARMTRKQTYSNIGNAGWRGLTRSMP